MRGGWEFVACFQYWRHSMPSILFSVFPFFCAVRVRVRVRVRRGATVRVRGAGGGGHGPRGGEGGGAWAAALAAAVAVVGEGEDRISRPQGWPGRWYVAITDARRSRRAGAGRLRRARAAAPAARRPALTCGGCAARCRRVRARRSGGSCRCHSPAVMPNPLGRCCATRPRARSSSPLHTGSTCLSFASARSTRCSRSRMTSSRCAVGTTWG